jgi:hypothetical protein
MLPRWYWTAIVAFVWASPALGQGFRFQWKPGQVLTYHVEQETYVTEVIDGKQTEMKSKVASTKRWQVLELVKGEAILQLSLVALHVETVTPGGEIMLFDSANPDKSTPELKGQMSQYIGQPIAVLRLNERGIVSEVKQCKFGVASRFESEPPFVVTFSDDPQKHAWDRNYQMTLEPPHGTGEKYEALQQYRCQKTEGTVVAVSISTSLKTQPDALADRVPLLQLQPEGLIQFDTRNGVLRSARLHIDRELKGHQGEGSVYHLQSTYVEELKGSE